MHNYVYNFNITNVLSKKFRQIQRFAVVSQNLMRREDSSPVSDAQTEVEILVV